jgi:signal transduction histidine kinase
MKTLKELQREIRQTIRQLEETASKSEVFIEAEDNIAGESIDIEPKKLSFNQELNILSKLNDLYRERAEYVKNLA